MRPSWGGAPAFVLEGVAALGGLAALAAPLAAVFPMRAGLPALVYGRPEAVTVLVTCGRAGAGLALVAALAALRAGWDAGVPAWSRLGLAAGAALLLAFVPWGRYWALL